MNDPFAPHPLSSRLRVMRIIHVALCFGSAAVLAILVYMRQVNPPAPIADEMITYIAIGFAVLGMTLAFFVPATMEGTWRRQVAQGKQPGSSAPGGTPLPNDPQQRWASLFQTRLIVRYGLLEGPIFAEAIFFFLVGSPVVLGMGMGLWVLLVLQHPTLTGLLSWIETQESLAQQQRGLDGR